MEVIQKSIPIFRSLLLPCILLFLLRSESELYSLVSKILQTYDSSSFHIGLPGPVYDGSGPTFLPPLGYFVNVKSFFALSLKVVSVENDCSLLQRLLPLMPGQTIFLTNFLTSVLLGIFVFQLELQLVLICPSQTHHLFH